MLQFGVASHANMAKGGLRHLLLMLLVSPVAVEARVLPEASVHPAQAPRINAKTPQAQLQPGQCTTGDDAAVAASQFCLEGVPSTFTMRDADNAARPTCECHHGSDRAASDGTDHASYDYALALLAAASLAAASGLSAALCASQRALARQRRVHAHMCDVVRERLRAHARRDAACCIESAWFEQLLYRAAVLHFDAAVTHVQACARRHLVAQRLDDASLQCELDTFFDADEDCCANIDYDQVRGHRWHGSSVGKLPMVVAGLAWFRGQVCVIQAAVRGFLARRLIGPWTALAPKLPSGLKVSDVLLLRVVFGKRLDVVSALLPSVAGGPLVKTIRGHVDSVRERLEKKGVKNAKARRARKAAQHQGPPGSLKEVEGVLYCLKGWNQLPIPVLRKRWTRGPSGSRSLSAVAGLLLATLEGADADDCTPPAGAQA